MGILAFDKGGEGGGNDAGLGGDGNVLEFS